MVICKILSPLLFYNFAEIYIYIYLFQFKNLLSQSNLAKQYLSNELTIFAPSDNAMNKYNGLKDDQFILNHMGKLTNSLEMAPKKCQKLRKCVFTQLQL